MNRVRARRGEETNTVRELPGAAARLARRRRGGVQGFLPLKSLFICRSGRDGNSLACPLPWLCFRPEGLVTCCFFTDFCARCLFFRFALFMRVFSLLFFCPFLPNFFLSNLFSFVAQAATGIPLLVPSRGFVSGLRILLSAAFSRAFAPIACLPVLHCLCGFSLSCFFAFSCLTSSSQTSFHLSLRPRRASTFFRKESRQRFAKGLRPFEPHSSALRPISPFPALLAGLSGPLGRKPPADKGNA